MDYFLRFFDDVRTRVPLPTLRILLDNPEREYRPVEKRRAAQKKEPDMEQTTMCGGLEWEKRK